MRKLWLHVINRVRYVMVRLAGLWILLVAWGVCSWTEWLPHRVLPAPWDVLQRCRGFVTGTGWLSPYAGQFGTHALASIGRVSAGFFIAAATGITLGVFCAGNRRMFWLFDPLVQLIRSIPGIAWLPLAIVWFGIGSGTAVFLIALAAFFPVYINTFQGVVTIPKVWFQAARTLGATESLLVWRITLPAAWPAICSGLRLAVGVSWAYVVLGELTGVNEGLGAMIMDARMMGDVPTVLVGMIFIAALGRLSDLLLIGITGRIWRRKW